MAEVTIWPGGAEQRAARDEGQFGGGLVRANREGKEAADSGHGTGRVLHFIAGELSLDLRPLADPRYDALNLAGVTDAMLFSGPVALSHEVDRER